MLRFISFVVIGMVFIRPSFASFAPLGTGSHPQACAGLLVDVDLFIGSAACEELSPRGHLQELFYYGLDSRLLMMAENSEVEMTMLQKAFESEAFSLPFAISVSRLADKKAKAFMDLQQQAPVEEDELKKDLQLIGYSYHELKQKRSSVQVVKLQDDILVYHHPDYPRSFRFGVVGYYKDDGSFRLIGLHIKDRQTSRNAPALALLWSENTRQRVLNMIEQAKNSNQKGYLFYQE